MSVRKHCLAVDRVRSVVDAFDDANVALRSIAQDCECGLVAGAVVGGNRLSEAVELDQYGALINPDLISFGNTAAREVATATGENGRNGKLCIFFTRRGVVDRAIAHDPVCFGHGFLRDFAAIFLSTKPPPGPINEPHIGRAHARRSRRVEALVTILEDGALARSHMQTPSRFQEDVRGRFASPLHVFDRHNRIKQMEELCRQ